MSPEKRNGPLGTTPESRSNTQIATKQIHDHATAINAQAVRKSVQPLLDEANKIGQIPMPGSPAWCELADEDPRKLAALLYAASWWCDQHTPEALAERAEFNEWDERRSLREASWAISRATEWGRSGPSFAELERRRAIYPPSRPIDPEAVARWVQTGSSEPEEVAA